MDKSDLNQASEANLKELSATLNKYEDTEVLIEGHTDADGADDHNQELSEARAYQCTAVWSHRIEGGTDHHRVW